MFLNIPSLATKKVSENRQMPYLRVKAWYPALMAVILFYSPFNQRSRDTETLMIGFRTQGHQVISLSQQEGLVIHGFSSKPGRRDLFLRTARTKKRVVVLSSAFGLFPPDTRFSEGFNVDPEKFVEALQALNLPGTGQ